jgi:HSP20 family protein
LYGQFSVSLIKKHNSPIQGVFNRLIDSEIYGMPSYEHSLNTLPKVNLLENDNAFNIMLAAPGLDKNDFKLDLNKQVLKVSVQINEENEILKFNKREFNYNSFSRSFNLPKSARLDKVNASYKDGILNIEIPKKDEAKPVPPRSIKID